MKLLAHHYYKRAIAGTSLALVLSSIVQLPSVAQSTPPNQTRLQNTPLIAPVRENATNYLLGPGDQIAINVLGYEEFNGSQVILPDGTISLSLIGAVTATNQTPTTLAQVLTDRLKPYLIEPVVIVNLTALRPIVVNVSGEVRRPGSVQLRGSTTTNTANPTEVTASTESNPRLSTAIIATGGITADADIRNVVLRRLLPGGGYTTVSVNLWDVIWAENAPQDPLLQDGDSIFVPQLAAGEQMDQRLIARSQLSPTTVPVRVVGEVKNPGEIQVPPGSSLSTAVAIAGGPTGDARLSRVAFIRMNQEGAIERQIVDLRNLLDTYQVQEGDVIIVPTEDSSSLIDFASRLFNPLGAFFNILNGF
ncbi:polysaccharide export protein [Oscillatoria sp. FACHB-1407]|uniref:SLBB domain-containing protein n=1 Tax=Oscillatoria sp. FACHB-1407 TaxID=2692847 RepID=UPI0016871496|nr:polysaccharide biosynthesis/export family protein [Oscillatoria sp. FACHB-1407]MBD2459688.1 polysaccharide export protein [Oscillatoria sp. FACHB-1407]